MPRDEREPINLPRAPLSRADKRLPRAATRNRPNQAAALPYVVPTRSFKPQALSDSSPHTLGYIRRRHRPEVDQSGYSASAEEPASQRRKLCEQPDALVQGEDHTSESFHVGMDDQHNPSADDEHMHDDDSEHADESEDQATVQFPEYCEMLPHHYDLDSHEGREAASVLFDFEYEFLTLLAPREVQSIALYKTIEKNVSRDALLSFSGLLATVTGSPALDVPRKTFDYIPVQHRLLLQYANPQRVQDLKSCRIKFDSTTTDLCDFWDANSLHRTEKEGDPDWLVVACILLQR